MKTNWLVKLGGSEFKVCRMNDAPIASQPKCDNPQTVGGWLREQLATAVMFRPDVENLIVVSLSVRCWPIGFEVIANGTLDTILCHPREVFKSAIVSNAHSIILAHNHPSGDPTPSEADIKVTRDMYRAGQLMKIELRDHIILGDRTYPGQGICSLREMGYLYNA